MSFQHSLVKKCPLFHYLIPQISFLSLSTTISCQCRSSHGLSWLKVFKVHALCRCSSPLSLMAEGCKVHVLLVLLSSQGLSWGKKNSKFLHYDQVISGIPRSNTSVLDPMYKPESTKKCYNNMWTCLCQLSSGWREGLGGYEWSPGWHQEAGYKGQGGLRASLEGWFQACQQQRLAEGGEGRLQDPHQQHHEPEQLADVQRVARQSFD